MKLFGIMLIVISLLSLLSVTIFYSRNFTELPTVGVNKVIKPPKTYSFNQGKSKYICVSYDGSLSCIIVKGK